MDPRLLSPSLPTRRTRLLLITGVSALFSLALLAFRRFYTGDGSYTFLAWNLFLAAIPFFLSSLLVGVSALQRRRPAFLATLGAWLLFFPNAPYIVTDLLHLRYRTGAPPWFDLILLVSFSTCGLLLGFLSLSDVQDVLRRRVGALAASVFAAAALVAGAFGIYLGRFLRWNSWDLLSQPAQLLRDVAGRVLNPLSDPKAVAVTALLSIRLSLWDLTFQTVAGPRTLPRSPERAEAGRDSIRP